MSAYRGKPAVIRYDPPRGTDPVTEEYHARGERAPWEKVYRDGVDVTDEPPETWGWPWSAYYAGGWRPWQPPNDGVE